MISLTTSDKSYQILSYLLFHDNLLGGLITFRRLPHCHHNQGYHSIPSVYLGLGRYVAVFMKMNER